MANACPSCAGALPPGSRFCPACGGAVDPAETPTVLSAGPGSGATREAGRGHSGSGNLPGLHAAPVTRTSAEPQTPSSWSSDAVSHGRFVPGQMLGHRYRIVELLGRGGMGEIYRADDLRLGQSVALKFLPDAFASDAAFLARLHGEVRMARLVSHPNVCRVYDIEDEGGHPFLAMEYVDGEDLASLLRRIGRLPADKGVEIARQICAGLAAAHDRGLLHRDLKPGNVMLDGRGKARITDFGLATAAGQATDIRSGTPGYMAPEQRDGREVTTRSDIYALGVVLYELFTGRHPFDPPGGAGAGGPAYAAPRLRTRGTGALAPSEGSEPVLTHPSTVVEGLDPAIERIILRCLETDPARRPASPLAVAAALPGGDPLAAALAAGETPSPEMVAAAGRKEGLRPAVAWTCLAGVAVGLVIACLAIPPMLLINRAGEIKPPDALADRAAEIARTIAPDLVVADRARGFLPYEALVRNIERTDSSPTRWDKLSRYPAVLFWYRSSPRAMTADQYRSQGVISTSDPALDVSGMTSIQLDGRGRLISYELVPPQRDDTPAADAEPDWSFLLSAAGVDVARLNPVTPAWNPLVACDRRAAWTLDMEDGTTVRYEAGAYRGRPVYFEAIFPWDPATRMVTEPLGMQKILGVGLVIVVLTVLLAVGLSLARRNLKSGRGDRRGTVRFGVALFLLFLSSSLLQVHFAATPLVVNVVFFLLSDALFAACLFMMTYVAFEPIVRRIWPDLLISWTRLLSGWVRDPLVGRDLLGGALLGTSLRLLPALGRFIDGAAGRPPKALVATLAGTSSPADAFGELLGAVGQGLSSPFVLLFFVVIFRAILRKNVLAIAATTLVFGAINTLNERSLAPGAILVTFIAVATSLFALQKFGFLFFASASVVARLLVIAPLTADLSAWYSGFTMIAIGLVAALAAFGFHAATSGRPSLADPVSIRSRMGGKP